MRQIFIEALDRQVSALGFGSASLGSRISPEQGLRALHSAFESGVTWFDTAPPYGDGKAEALLGQFLRGKREEVAICTKVGIAPVRLSLAARLGKPVVRAALSLAPDLRAQIARRRPLSIRMPIDPAAIETSVVGSLRRLGVDHVDVLALHDPTLEEVLDEDVRAALTRMVEKGYTKMVGIAGERSVGERGVGAGYQMLQHAAGSPPPAIPSTRALRVTHSVYGMGGALARLSAALTDDQALRHALLNLGFDGSDKEIAASALLDFALSNNRNGVVLSSMFDPKHLAFNVERTKLPTNDKIVDVLQGYISQERLP